MIISYYLHFTDKKFKVEKYSDNYHSTSIWTYRIAYKNNHKHCDIMDAVQIECYLDGKLHKHILIECKNKDREF